MGLDDFNDFELSQFKKDKKEDITRLLSVGISTKDICNLKCRYCYGDQNHKRNSELLSKEEQIGIIDQAYKCGSKTLIICADWEPTMDENLVPIIKFAYSKGMTTVLFTNGLIFGNDNLAQQLHNMSSKNLADFCYSHNCSLMMKLDSLEKDTYENIVAVKGSYQDLKSALGNLMDVGYGKVIRDGDAKITKWAFAAVVLKPNFEEIPKLKKFANDNHAQFICKLPAIINRATENRALMFPTEEYDKIRSEYLSKYSDRKETLTVADNCMAWFYGIVFDNVGEARQCYTLPYKNGEGLGNIREKSLTDILSEKKLEFELNQGWPCPAKRTIHN
jgi:MoaA/NifB/PqqE/SkfB family radical SAM enzyme